MLAFTISHFVFSITKLKSALKGAGSAKYSPPILESLQRKSTGLNYLEEKTQTKHALHNSFSLSDTLHTLGLSCKGYCSQLKKTQK